MRCLPHLVQRLTAVTQSQANALGEMQQRHQQQMHQQQSQMNQQQHANLERLVEMQGIVVKLQDRPESPKRVTFLVIKGIGKPPTFASGPQQFSSWSFKLGNFLEGIVARMKDALGWAQEQEKDTRDLEELKPILGDGADAKDLGRQLHALIAQLVEGDALDTVQNNESSSGRETWRQFSSCSQQRSR